MTKTRTPRRLAGVLVGVALVGAALAGNSVAQAVDAESRQAAPVADAKGPYVADPRQPVLFDGRGSTPSDSIVSYKWNFGDGSSATGSVLSHSYFQAGIYTVTLTVTDNLGATDTDTTTATIGTIGSPPIADAGGPYSGAVGVAIVFDGTGSTDDGTIASYSWDFGDGSTGTGASPSHAYGGSGTFTVTLVVTDDQGATDDDTATATITISGAAVYAAQCVACHGVNGEGGFGPSLQASTLSLAQITTIVRNGGGNMPAFSGTLTTEQIDAVAAYTKALQSPTATTTTSTTLPPSAGGSAIYAQKCAGCHGANGEGGIGPSLQVSTLSVAQITSLVTAGQGSMPGFSGSLSSTQISAVSTFVKGLQSSTATTTTSTTLPPSAGGSEVYAAQCAGCHGANGEGGIGPSLQVSTLSAAQITSLVTAGQGSMPGFSGSLSATQIDAVSTFVKGLQSSTATTTTLAASAGGSEVYAEKCAGCHGANGEGGIGPSLQVSTLSAAQITSLVTAGQGSMPGFSGSLSATQIDAVSTFVKGLQSSTATTTTLAASAGGSAIYAAQCAACHGANGQGGVGPSLQASTLSSSAIAGLVRSGRGTMPGFASTLSSAQISAVSSFARSLQSSSATTTSTTALESTDGAAVYTAKCAQCHGPHGSGGIGPALAGTELSEAEIVTLVESGRGTMPGFRSDLSTEQIAAVAQYIAGLGQLATDGDAAAAEVFAARCAGCHGANGEGDIGPAVAGTQLSSEAFRAVVAAGRGAMPGFGSDLTDTDIEGLRIYLAGLGSTDPMSAGGQVAAADIFAARCAVCHGPNGEGGIGPALTQTALEEDAIADVIRNGRQASADGTGGMPGFGELLTGDEVQSLASYVAALAEGTPIDEDVAEAAFLPSESSGFNTGRLLALGLAALLVIGGVALTRLGPSRSAP